MNLDWRKVVAVLAVLIAVVGIIVPDACADDAVTGTPTSAAVSAPHTGDQPFGCQHEEDCFCCAHFAATTGFVLHTSFVVTKAIEQPSLSSIDQVPTAPYHPPKA
jgi:hypothetical protein